MSENNIDQYWREQIQVLQNEINMLNGYIDTLDQENRQIRARNERLEKEVKDLEYLLKSK